MTKRWRPFASRARVRKRQQARTADDDLPAEGRLANGETRLVEVLPARARASAARELRHVRRLHPRDVGLATEDAEADRVGDDGPESTDDRLEHVCDCPREG
jgi:hypothetical protein